MNKFRENPGYKSHQYLSNHKSTFKVFSALILVTMFIAFGFTLVESFETLEKVGTIEVAIR